MSRAGGGDLHAGDEPFLPLRTSIRRVTMPGDALEVRHPDGSVYPLTTES